MTDFNTLPQTILMWANQDPKYPNSFIIKMDNQKILGLTRTDKRGETYWKFKERVKVKVVDEKTNNPESSPVMDNIQKFQQRQAKTEQLNNHGKLSSNPTEQSVNNQQSS